jgi:hypothetical protein
MTAEEARTISRRAVIIRYVKTIDEKIYAAAERGEYYIEYVNKDSYGNFKDFEQPVLQEIIKHYLNDGFRAYPKKDSKCRFMVAWNEPVTPEIKIKEEVKEVQPQITD